MKTILALTIALLSMTATAETTYLYVILHDDNSNGERFRTEMESMGQCLEALKHSKMPTPSHPGGDYEVLGAMFCGSGKFQSHSLQHEWKDNLL